MSVGYSIKSESISLNYLVDHSNLHHVNGDHCHDKYEITYILTASGRYIIEGSEHKVNRGNLLLISPVVYHKVDIDDTSPLEMYSIHFSKVALSDKVASMLDQITDGDNSRGIVYPHTLISDELVRAFERFSTAVRLGQNEADAYMQAILTEIIILLSASEGERINQAGEELGARVARYLNANIERNISLDRLARRFFVSKYHLCRAFKSYSGTSVHSYVNHKRIIHAKGLIESGLTASKAAERVGFGDYSAFYRAYLKVVGKSPTAE